MTRRFVKLRLDLKSFDEKAFAAPTPGLETGLAYTTFGIQGDTPDNRRLLYELNRQCSADIPGRGPFYDFPEYVTERLDGPSFDPEGVTLALDGDHWVGMSAVSDWRHKGFMFAEMTGVIRSHRRRGIGLAMKLHSIRHAQQSGARWLLTICDNENPAPIALNRRFGFEDADWPSSLLQTGSMPVSGCKTPDREVSSN